ncbi:hypothetical protein WMF31_04025 [Sorangium sp. So ce1036]|uniref:hypothetical protein n=1 Tax=Sorangium sp. So ce1036 TaxID=3133328 RepID=UPI003F0C69EF
MRLDQIGDRPLRAVLDEACPSPEATSMLMLTHLEEARDLARICAQLNVHRNELAQRFALPWVLAAHPAAALRLQQIAPNFCDFAGLWLLDEQAADAELGTLEQAIDAPAVPQPPSSHLGGGPGTSELLERASVAISLGRLDEAADLLAQYDLDNPGARSNVAPRIRLGGQLHWKRGRPIEVLACFERALERCEALGDLHGKAVLLTDIARSALQRVLPPGRGPGGPRAARPAQRGCRRAWSGRAGRGPLRALVTWTSALPHEVARRPSESARRRPILIFPQFALAWRPCSPSRSRLPPQKR